MNYTNSFEIQPLTFFNLYVRLGEWIICRKVRTVAQDLWSVVRPNTAFPHKFRGAEFAETENDHHKITISVPGKCRTWKMMGPDHLHHLCIFQACDLVHFPGLWFGPSFSRSIILQACDLVCHFPGASFSSPVIWSNIFQVRHFQSPLNVGTGKIRYTDTEYCDQCVNTSTAHMFNSSELNCTLIVVSEKTSWAWLHSEYML